MNNFRTLGLEITKSCNFSCIHCYLKNELKENQLSLTFIKKIISTVGDLFTTICITGGEPLIHPEFDNIYLFLRKKGFIIELFTNASLLNNNNLNTLKKYPPHNIEVSIYGMENKTFIKVTKKEKYEHVLNNVLKLKNICKNIKLKFPILKENKKDIEPFISFCKKHYFNYSFNLQIIPPLTGNKKGLPYRLNRSEMEEVLSLGLIDIETINNKKHECDAGYNIFIDSKGFMRGCPVLIMDGDKSLLKDLNRKSFIKKMDDIRMICNNTNDICPSWSSLEKKSSIKSYINTISENL